MSEAFDPVDPTGLMAEECWRDVSRKLDRWHERRSTVAAMASDWDRHRAALRGLVATPARLATSLAAAGAAAQASALDPPATSAVVRWAMRALPLMRDRFTVADLRFFAGDWDDETIDGLLERSEILGDHG